MIPKLRVLANVRFYNLAGISQYLAAFFAENARLPSAERLDIVGVDVLSPREVSGVSNPGKIRGFRLVTRVVDYPELGEANRRAKGRLVGLRECFADVTRAYAEIIRAEQPDVILVSGSYFLPWCLFQAAREYGRAKIVVHYHGVLREEVAHWTNARDRALMQKMERDLYGRDVLYVFPSELTRETVARKVFSLADDQAVVLPNPVPDHFFRSRAAPRRSRRHLAAVSRWSPIKNPAFLEDLGRHLDRHAPGHRLSIVTDPNVGKHRPLARSVEILAPRRTRAMPKFFRKVGVVLSPSRFETYGNVAQEAVACGTPALVSDRMGVAETFREIGLGHFVVPFRSPRAVLKAARAIAAAGVPKSAIAALRRRCGAAKIYGRYAEILRAGR